MATPRIFSIYRSLFTIERTLTTSSLLHRTTATSLLRPLAGFRHFSPSTAVSSGGLRTFSTRQSSMNDNSPNWSNRPPKETILLDGCDFEHWLVVTEPPPEGATRDEIIDSYIKTLSQVIGSEEEARMKIYSVSTRCYFAFGALVSEELSYKLKELPNVRWVLPDSYLDVKNKDYGGEPFINGQAVPYDPKYHEEWIRNNQKAMERNRRNDRPRNNDRSRNFERRQRGGPGGQPGGNMGPPPNMGGAPPAAGALGPGSGMHNQPPTGAPNAGGYRQNMPPPNPAGGYGQNMPPPNNAGGYGQNMPPPNNAGGYGQNMPPPNHAGGYGQNMPPPNNAGYGQNVPRPNNAGYGQNMPPNNAGYGQTGPPPNNAGYGQQNNPGFPNAPNFGGGQGNPRQPNTIPNYQGGGAPYQNQNTQGNMENQTGGVQGQDVPGRDLPHYQ